MTQELLQYIISVQDKASKALDNVNSRLGKLEDNSSKASKGTNGLNARIVALGTVLGNLATGGLSMAINGLAGLGQQAISSADAFAIGQLKYETLLGSSEKAQERVKQLLEFSARTPFEFQQIQKADVLLQGFGIRSEKLLTTIGDAAAISGSDFAELSLIIGQLSQSKDLENIKQLVERGVVSFEELRNAGIKFAKDGSVVNSVEETYSAITDIMAKKFGGGMEKLSGTFSGQLSTLRDNVSLFLGELATKVGGLDLFTNGLTRLNGLFETITADNVIGQVETAIGFLSEKFAPLAEQLPALQGAFINLNNALAPLYPILQQIAELAGGAIYVIFTELLPQAMAQSAKNFAFLMDIVSRAINIFNAVREASASLANAIAGAFSGMVDIVGNAIRGVITRINSGIGKINDAIGKVRQVPIVGENIPNIKIPTIPGFARGGDFIVPPGYKNDSYLIGVSSGERVQVTPPQQISNNNSRSIDIGQVIINNNTEFDQFIAKLAIL